MGDVALQSGIESDCRYLTYDQTGYFSKMVLDYLAQAPQVQAFFKHTPSLEGVMEVIRERSSFAVNRTELVQALYNQYQGMAMEPALQQHIQALADNNTFTVTTAHQPNIFTGPLYFIYKILHTIKLAADLQQQLPDYRFVPVYYMGSEDADLDELGNITIEGKRYEWKTRQTGAVGRMKVDKEFLLLLTEMRGQLGVQPYGNEIVDIFSACYTAGTTIQEATLKVVNTLFGRYGLVVVIPDNVSLKRLFIPVIKRELDEAFSHQAVAATIKELGQHYKVQAGGRDINLFYLIDDKRERIEKEGDIYTVQGLKAWTKEEIFQELEQNPERFSPNVILRGVFQETILPNLVFVGGGGELAYWLELKRVFAAAGVPYPVLLLRNSFTLVTAAEMEHFIKTGLPVTAFFSSMHEQMNLFVQAHSKNQVTLSNETAQVKALYTAMGELAAKVDPTLQQHVHALESQTLHKLENLQKKLLKAEKRKFGYEQNQLQQIRDKAFPGNNLQERAENMAGWYARWGSGLIDTILTHSKGIDSRFGIITLRRL